MKNSSEYDRELSRVAILHYECDLPASRIAEKLKISRSRVSQLITEAKRHGRVEVKVRPASMDRLEYKLFNLLSKYGIRDVRVAQILFGEDEKPQIKRSIGSFAASYLERSIRDGMRIAVTCGTTVCATIRMLKNFGNRNLQIIPLNAFLHAPLNGMLLDSNALALLAYAVLDSDTGENKAFLFPFTDLPEDNEMSIKQFRDTYQKHPGVQVIFEEADKADLILCGIGAFYKKEEATTEEKDAKIEKKVVINVQKLLDMAELGPGVDKIMALGAVGEINLRPFDQNGESLYNKLKKNLIQSNGLQRYFDYSIGKDLDYFKQKARTTKVVAVAGGKEKAPAIFAAIKGGYFETLITDEIVARELLRLTESA